jgi:AcrR family transcriptional regulator
VPRISERRRQERRDQILDAARDLFTRNGFHATSMDEILRAAGMSAGGLYRHFPSKEAIVTAIAEQVVSRLTAAIDEILAEDPVPPLPEALARVVRAIDVLAAGSGRLAIQVWGEAQRDPAIAALAAAEMSRIRTALVELVTRERAAGQLPVDADARELGQVLFALAPGYLVQKLILGDVDPDGFAAALGAVLPTTAHPTDGTPD